MQIIAGVDEAGRGPLAGPVVAAAVILDAKRLIKGLRDSKKLSEKQREALYPVITDQAISYAVAQASVEEIDTINILQASLLAMQRAVAMLNPQPQLALVDGNQAPMLACQVQTIIQGDQIEPAIAAASILAKVTRDRMLVQLDQQYPGYGLAQHKGYGTKAHLASLKALGPSKIHRQSYAPVRRLLGCNASLKNHL